MSTLCVMMKPEISATTILEAVYHPICLLHSKLCKLLIFVLIELLHQFIGYLLHLDPHFYPICVYTGLSPVTSLLGAFQTTYPC